MLTTRIWKCLHHEGLTTQISTMQRTFRLPTYRYFNKYCSAQESSYFPGVQGCLIQQRIDGAEYYKERSWMMSIFFGSVINECAQAVFQVYLMRGWLPNTVNTLRDSLKRFALPPDKFDKLHEQGIEKVKEAQLAMQQKLTKAREEYKKVASKAEKEALEIMIKSTEESISQLLELQKKMKAELKKK